MTRLTINVVGDPLTFRPVTSSIVRESKEGNVNVVIMLFGTHYNIKMDGILQQDTSGDISGQTITVADSEVALTMQRSMGGTGTAELIGSFSSFMYFFPGLKLKGHLKLSETSHGPVVPELEGNYTFIDLLSEDKLIFRLIRDELNLRFETVEEVSGVEHIIYSENLAVGIDEIFFEFVYLEQGRSKLFTYEDYAKLTQVKTRKWIGNVTAKIGECNVSIRHKNSEEVEHTVNSDLVFLQYPEIFLKFDRDSTDRFIGHVRMFDDNNSAVEADWGQIRSRDYKFIGNRVIENGMIRVIVNTMNPVIEIWGWNIVATIPTWVKCMSIVPESTTGVQPLKVQNVIIEYFTSAQIKVEVNFGTSLYTFIMSRGDPYITMLEKAKLNFRFHSGKSRFIGDFADQANGYTAENSFEGGTPLAVAASGTVTLVGVVNLDTITVNGIVYTGVTGAKADNTEFSVDGSDTVDAADLVDSIVNDVRQGVTKTNIDLTAANVSNVVTITAKAGGIGGNLIDLASSDGGRLAVSGALFTGGADTGGTGVETLTGFTLEDNWFAVYNEDSNEDLIGWISNIINPTAIDMVFNSPDVEYKFTYPRAGNIIAIGVLSGVPTSLIGNTPTPFVVGTQDKYVKWRANEAVLAFKEAESIKRR